MSLAGPSESFYKRYGNKVVKEDDGPGTEIYVELNRRTRRIDTIKGSIDNNPNPGKAMHPVLMDWVTRELKRAVNRRRAHKENKRKHEAAKRLRNKLPKAKTASLSKDKHTSSPAADEGCCSG